MQIQYQLFEKKVFSRDFIPLEKFLFTANSTIQCFFQKYPHKIIHILEKEVVLDAVKVEFMIGEKEDANWNSKIFLEFFDANSYFFPIDFCIVDGQNVWLSNAKKFEDVLSIEVLFLSQQTDIVGEFQQLFYFFQQKVYGKAPPNPQYSYKIDNGAKAGTVSIFWGYAEKPLAKIVQDITNARSRISLYTSYFSGAFPNRNNDIIHALNNIYKKGIPVEVYTDSSVLKTSQSAIYSLASGIPVYSLGYDPQARPRPRPRSYGNENLQIVVIDRDTRHERIFLFFGQLHYQADTQKMGLLLELTGTNAKEHLHRFFRDVQNYSQELKSQSDIVNKGEVVINEILWQGTVDNNQSRDSYDEFIELKNNRNTKVYLSYWHIACKDNSNNIHPIIQLPRGAYIKPNGFYTIAKINTKIAPLAQYQTNLLGSASRSIKSNTVGCILVDANTSASVKEYNLAGSIVDSVGNDKDEFDTQSESHYSISGLRNSNFDNYGSYRSMEKKQNSSLGYSSNTFSILENIFVPEQFSQYTFATPNAKNSHFANPLHIGAAIINELLVHGSIDNALQNHQKNDIAIEVKNNTNQYINMSYSYLKFLSNDGEAKTLFFPLGLVLPPNSFFIFREKSLYAVQNAGYFTTNLPSLVSTSQISLHNSANTAIDTAGRTEAETGAEAGAENFFANFPAFFYENQPVENNISFSRSIERKPGGDGTNASSWHANTFSMPENTSVHRQYNQKTFTSLGKENSHNAIVPIQKGAIVISEIHWSGSKNNTKKSSSSDDFIEIHNTTSRPIDMSHTSIYNLGSSNCSFGDNCHFVFPLGTRMAPHSFVVVKKKQDSFVRWFDYIYSNMNLTYNPRQIALVDAHQNTIDTSPNADAAERWAAGTSTTIKRSMERIAFPYQSGENALSWNTSQFAGNGISLKDYRIYTYATPKEANSINRTNDVPPVVQSIRGSIPSQFLQILFSKPMDAHQFHNQSIRLRHSTLGNIGIVGFLGLGENDHTANFLVDWSSGMFHNNPVEFSVGITASIQDRWNNPIAPSPTPITEAVVVPNSNTAKLIIKEVLANPFQGNSSVIRFFVLQAGTIEGFQVFQKENFLYEFRQTRIFSTRECITLQLNTGINSHNTLYLGKFMKLSSRDLEIAVMDAHGFMQDYVSINSGSVSLTQKRGIEKAILSGNWFLESPRPRPLTPYLPTTKILPTHLVSSSLDNIKNHSIQRTYNTSTLQYNDTNTHNDFIGALYESTR